MAYPTLTVNKDSKFFVALCKDADDVHSFVSLGVEIEGSQVLLGAFGKVISPYGSTCGFFFWETRAKIKSERIFWNRENEANERDFFYKAYAINYEQYLETLHYLKAISSFQQNEFFIRRVSEEDIQKEVNLELLSKLLDNECGCIVYNNKLYYVNHEEQVCEEISDEKWMNSEFKATIDALPLNAVKSKTSESVRNMFTNLSESGTFRPWDYSPLEAYCPTSVNNDQIELQWNNLNAFAADKTPTISQAELHTHLQIGSTNNCRHSALSFTRLASHMYDLGKGIYSFFLMAPPLKTKVLGGVLGANGEHIYILPLPPQSYAASIDPKQLTILVKLYERLDKLLQNEQMSEVTVKKFEKIKSLYEDITSNKKGNLNVVFDQIVTWVNENKNLIKTHRKSHWISFPTATEQMFDNILKSRPKL